MTADRRAAAQQPVVRSTRTAVRAARQPPTVYSSSSCMAASFCFRFSLRWSYVSLTWCQRSAVAGLERAFFSLVGFSRMFLCTCGRCAGGAREHGGQGRARRGVPGRGGTEGRGFSAGVQTHVGTLAWGEQHK